jgi:hypothetical protein
MTTTCPANWVQRYEDLRANSLGSLACFGAPSWGLALLVQQGVRGWMLAWRDPLRAATAEPGPSLSTQGPLSNPRETTLLLANMAMRTLASSL